LVVAVAAGAGFALAFGLPGAGAKGYSAYDDPDKPALSFILSDEKNVDEFQQEFGLSNEKIGEVRAVVRNSNDALFKVEEESDRIVESNESASNLEIRKEIANSDVDERVKQIVARTNSEIESSLPDGRADDLGSWVNEQWRTETAEYEASSEASYQASSTGFSCRVWMTFYNGNTDFEVALPHKKVKFSGGHRVKIKAVRIGTSARPPVRETGPWNIRDNYWRASRDRSMWRDLPRCVPEAQAAFFRNYNGGKNQFGNPVTNPAGIDVTPEVARRMHVWKKLRFEGLLKVRVHFPWVRR